MQPLTPEQKQWRMKIFAATWMSYAGFYFCRKAFGIVKGPLKEALQVDDLELAHIWTAYLIAYMFGQFLAGWIGVRLACRNLLLAGMGISVVCNLAFGGATMIGPAGYWPFLVFMVLNGFAQATGWPGNVGTLAHWFRREERGTMMGFWGTCYQLGSIGAKASAAFFFGWLGLGWSFWSASIVLLAVWVGFYFLHADDPADVGVPAIVAEDARQEDEAEADSPAPATSNGWPPGALFTVMVMGATYFNFKFLRYALDSWSALVLSENFTLSTSTAGYISTTFDAVGFLGVLFAGFVTDRFFGGRRAFITFIMTVGMLVSAVVLYQFGLTSVLFFAVALAMLGFTLFGPDSLLSGTGAMDVGSKERAVLAAGIVNGMGSLGPVIQEEVIGYLKVHYSIDAVFGLLIAVAAMGCVGTGYLWYRGRQGKSNF